MRGGGKDVSEFLHLDVENFWGGSEPSDSSVTIDVFYVNSTEQRLFEKMSITHLTDKIPIRSPDNKNLPRLPDVSSPHFLSYPLTTRHNFIPFYA